MTNGTSTSTSEATFATRANNRPDDPMRGDTVLYRSPTLSDGRPADLPYRSRTVVQLLDTRTGCPWLNTDANGCDDFSMAPVPYLGALSVVLSDLVDDGADDATDDDHDQRSAMVDALAEQLDDDESQVTLPDGRILRLRVEVDESTTVDDESDTYGRIVWCDRDSDAQRPAGFDGNAEKLGVGPSYDRCWWQPPTDGPRRGTEEFRAERAHLLDLLDYGFVGYVVELCDAEPDRYGRLIVRESASLWGIDSRDVEAEMVAELVWEVLGY